MTTEVVVTVLVETVFLFCKKETEKNVFLVFNFLFFIEAIFTLLNIYAFI